MGGSYKRDWEKEENISLLKDWTWIKAFLFISEEEHFLPNPEQVPPYLIFLSLSVLLLICSSISSLLTIVFFFLRFYLFLERGEGRERNINVWLPLERPLLWTWACALTGN